MEAQQNSDRKIWAKSVIREAIKAIDGFSDEILKAQTGAAVEEIDQMTAAADRETCKRCRGTANVGGPVLHYGIPGGCFRCDVTGQALTRRAAVQIGQRRKALTRRHDEFAGKLYQAEIQAFESIETLHPRAWAACAERYRKRTARKIEALRVQITRAADRLNK